MKKLFKIFFILFLFSPIIVEAKIGTVDATNGVTLRKGAGTSYSKITVIPFQKDVTINSEKNTDDKTTGCPTNKWLNITYGSYTGYVCSYYIIDKVEENVEEKPKEEIILTDMAKMTDEEYDKYLKDQGFTGNYLNSLKALHKIHPNWVFKGIKAKYTWSNALSQETVLGRSLLQVNSTGVSNGLQGYLNTSSDCYNYLTDTFKAYDGSTWYQASDQTIAYYLDPRNFLTESGIFMFEDLKYYKSYQTENVVKKILYTDFFKNYTKYYIEAAEKYNVSPVYLAALSRQEVGLNSSTATSGKAGTYNGVNYNGYYNFYNIGATSGANPVYNGLAYSKSKNWNTVQKAIVEGASWIVSGYINVGQYTQYFQKWNTSPDSTSGIWHQYMTNIKALISPAATTLASYKSMSIVDEPLVFTIPIYTGMPDKTTLPPTGNPNNYLKTLLVDGTSVKEFASATTNYDLGKVSYEKTTVKVTGTTINKYASIDGDGTITLAVGENKLPIVVTAQNGSKKTYTLKITRENKKEDKPSEEVKPEEDKPEVQEEKEPSVVDILNKIAIKNNDKYLYGFTLGTKASDISKKILEKNPNSTSKITNSKGTVKTNELATGDKVSITSNKETKTYEVIIYGDINGDGKINASDLLYMRKHLLKESTLKSTNLEAARLARNTSVDARDLLVMRKYLLNTGKISQL